MSSPAIYVKKLDYGDYIPLIGSSERIIVLIS